MNTEIVVAIITASVSVLVAALTFFFTKSKERADQLQQRKQKHYTELLAAITDLADHEVDLQQARRRFAGAVNSLVLVAPQSVVSAVMAYYRELAKLRTESDLKERSRLLKALVLELRESLELPFVDDPDSFDFELLGVSKPPETPDDQ